MPALRERPNVLVIKSDQHNARCLGASGHPQVRTPHLDEMARDGVYFTQAFVQSPICSPSRMSYLTGQYVHNHGVYGNIEPGEVPHPNIPPLFQVFKENGYITGIAGHFHVAPQWLEPHCDICPRDVFAPGDAYDAYLESKGLLHLRDDEAYDGHMQTREGCPSRLDFIDSTEGYCYQSFCEFLEKLGDQGPFIFEIGCVHPHENYIPAREFWDLYEGQELTLPPSADEDLGGKPTHQQRQAQGERNNPNMWVFEPRTYEAGRLRKFRGYFGCVSQVDHMVGLIRGKLQETGRADNTILVYCSDHGDFALEHGFLEKAPGISYDAVLRVPFIWYWPRGGFVARRVHELVESVDLFPTLCCLAGLEVPETVDGCDLAPLLMGQQATPHQFVVAEFPYSHTIRTREWKLCHRPRDLFGPGDAGGEMYHVSEDPWEMNNVYSDPRFQEVREELRRQLFDWLLATTRYGCTLPAVPHGRDGKATLTGMRDLVARGRLDYL